MPKPKNLSECHQIACDFIFDKNQGAGIMKRGIVEALGHMLLAKLEAHKNEAMENDIDDIAAICHKLDSARYVLKSGCGPELVAALPQLIRIYMDDGRNNQEIGNVIQAIAKDNS